MRVLKISCSLLFVVALAHNAGAQSSEQSAKAALSSAKKPKGSESSVAAQQPTRVLINFTAAANTTPAANRQKPSQQLNALMNVQSANQTAARPAAPGAVRKPAKKTTSAEH